MSFSDVMGVVVETHIDAALAALDSTIQRTEAAGALLMYDEAHLLADDRRRSEYPLSHRSLQPWARSSVVGRGCESYCAACQRSA